MVSSVLILCLLSSLSSVLSETSVYEIEADLNHICIEEDELEANDVMLIDLVYSYLEDGAINEGNIEELTLVGSEKVITEECNSGRSLQKSRPIRLKFKTEARCGDKCPEEILVVDDSVPVRSNTDATPSLPADAEGRRELSRYAPKHSHYSKGSKGTGNGKYKYQNGGHMNHYNNNRNYYNSNYYHSTDYYYNSNYYNSNYYNNNNNNRNHNHNNYYNKNHNHRGGKGSKSGHNHQQSGGYYDTDYYYGTDYYHGTDYYNHHHHETNNHHHHETNSDNNPDRCECFLPSNRDLQSCAPRPVFTGKGKGRRPRPVIVVPEYVGEQSLAKYMNCKGFERITNAEIVSQKKIIPCGKGQCGKGSKVIGQNNTTSYGSKGSKGYYENTANGGYYTSKGSKGSGEYYGSKGSKGYYESKVSKDHKTKSDKGKSSKTKGAKY